jgi:N-acyl-D-aspartate/D-glutamate deacylase
MMSEFDLVIRGGSVIDGNGEAAFSADVAVIGDRIVEVGKVSGVGRREISADGALVSPGFVDIHTHYDGQATWASRLQPSSWHGVTTAVMGNCGIGFAPVKSEDRDRLIQLMEGVEDIPGTALHEGLSWTWETFPEYLDALGQRSYDIDIATQVPHAALRVNVMGDRARAGSEANGTEIAMMAKLTKEAIQAGALGFSTSRSLHHQSVAGELIPSYAVGANELLAIARAVGETNTGVLQVISTQLVEEFPLLRELASVSGRPLSFSLLQDPKNPDGFRKALNLLDQARADGLQLLAQVACRPMGGIQSLEGNLHPFITNPEWKKLSHLSPAEQARQMKAPDVRDRIIEAQGRRILGPGETGEMLDEAVSNYDLMFPLEDPPNYEPDPSDSVAARAKREGRSAIELVYDLIAGGEMLYSVHYNYANGTIDGIGEMLRHCFTIPALSDGGAHVGLICDASFPTTLLQYWTRDREKDRLHLPFAIQRQTRDAAQAVGLFDRGVIAPGYRADLNVIDLQAMRLHRPEVHADLPAGGRRLLQRVDGYLNTIVGGVETYRNGEETGALPGRLVRGSQKPLSS